MVAARAGYFSQNGLDLEIRPGGFEADPIKLVAAGSDTFGVAGADSFLLARAKGVPVVAFAAGYLQTPVVFYVHADSAIKTPRDFVGKRVGVQAGQDTETVYQAVLKKSGVSRDHIKEVPVRYDFTPFLTHQVDVWPGYAATQSYILEQRKIPYRIIQPSDFGVSYLGTVYFTSGSYATRDPQAVQAFVNGIILGWNLVYSNYERAIPMIASFDLKTLTPDLIRFNLDRQRPFILPPGRQYCDFSAGDWEALSQTLADLKLLQNQTQVDLKAAVTMKFLDSRYRRAGAR
jgi:ABC-type nitrate/sulfonate/bicarbonate transport system substrate-binding protein